VDWLADRVPRSLAEYEGAGTLKDFEGWSFGSAG
jgi:hypothetical protein